MSRVSAAATQPGKSGTYAPNPFSLCSTTTRYCIGAILARLVSECCSKCLAERRCWACQRPSLFRVCVGDVTAGGCRGSLLLPSHLFEGPVGRHALSSPQTGWDQRSLLRANLGDVTPNIYAGLALSIWRDCCKCKKQVRYGSSASAASRQSAHWGETKDYILRSRISTR